MTKTISLSSALALLLTAAPAVADDPSGSEPARTKAEVMQMLRSEGRVPDEALAGLEQGIERNAGAEGYGSAVSSAAREAIQSGCTGTCLAEVVREVNGSIEKGLSPEEARLQAMQQARGSRATADAHRSDGARRDTGSMMRTQERMGDRARDSGVSRGGRR
jgi:hypothetical protein